MDTRQLIRFGKSSFVVSIPQNWIRRHSLQKGDKVHVFEQDDNLVLSAYREGTAEALKYELDTFGKEMNVIKTEIVSAYLNNYDILEISNREGLKFAVEIRDALQNLAGLEILEQTHKKIIARDLINMKELSITALMKRMDVIAKSMMSDFLETIEKPNDQIFKSIYHRDNDINRLCFLTYRVLRKAMITPSVRKDLELTQIGIQKAWLVSMRIEKIADFTKRMARHIADCKFSKKAKLQLKDLIRISIERYKKVMSYYYNFEKKKAFEIESDSDCIVKKCNVFRAENQSAEVTEVIENLKNLNAGIRNIARSVISGEDSEEQHSK